MVEALRYKLQMSGILIEGTSQMLCDNESVYKNMSTPESMLNKKNIIILYHKCRAAVADGLAWIYKEGKATNLADLFTKMLVQNRRKYVFGYVHVIMYL